MIYQYDLINNNHKFLGLIYPKKRCSQSIQSRIYINLDNLECLFILNGD
jgi:hypothetical protein